MSSEAWLALESSALGQLMRTSPFLYPVANVTHILALITFFSAVAMMDVRILGGFRQHPLSSVLGTCRPTAAGALVMQAGSGFLLFTAEASALAANGVFRLKMLVVVLGLANVAVLELVFGRRLRRVPGSVPSGARICALLSLTGWAMTAALGRLIAYF